MAYQSLTATADWPATPQYTAAAEIEVELINPTTTPVKWITTDDDTVPALAETDASQLLSSDSRSVILKAGERLWLAAPGLRAGSTPITLHY